MLQWMGGSRRKVATSRKSTQKRQKQYFEQRKRQQQNLQMIGSDNCFDGQGISGQTLKEQRSLDILNLLNLSTNPQQCNPFCPNGRDDGEISISTMPGSVSTNPPTMFTNVDTSVNSCRFEEAKAGAPLCCQIETSSKKSAPDHQNTAFNGPPNQWKTVTDQYSEFSVMDLFCDDEPNATAEKCPTCEDHVSFSLEGLGKVGTETPVHSPEQQARNPYSYSPLQKDGRKSKLKKLSHVLNDIEHEVDTMMQDIKVSPICSSDYPFNKVRQSSAIVGNDKHFYDHSKRSGFSVIEEFFKTKNRDEDLWNACSGFLDESFDNEMGYDTSCKKTFQMGSKSPELLKSGAYKMENYAFEDLLPKKWSSAIAMKEIDMSEPRSSFSKDELENDFDFYVASSSRLGGNFNAQNLIPEDVRDNSSLLSEESSSRTAERGVSTAHSPSTILTGENRRKHRNGFASPRKHRNVFASTRNKYSTKDEKYRSMPNSSKRMPSHDSNSILQEELDAHNSWQFEEINPSVDKSSVAASFCLDLEADFAVFGSKNKIEDPFSVFITPELSNKASPSFGGFRKAAPLADSPPCSFTSEKFAFDSSIAFPNVGSWPTGPSLSPDFQPKGKSEDACGGFDCETSSTDMSVQGSVSKGERQVKMQKDTNKSFEQEDVFLGDNELSSEKKMSEDAPSSKNHTKECEGTEDTNPKTTTQCFVAADSSGHVEEISSLLKKPDKQESQVDKRKNNCDAETPLKCNKSTKEEVKFWSPEGRTTMSGGKHKNGKISLSGQVMFESYVFKLLRVQKVLKEACT
ncbi:hypothetical protein GYH30_049093 [Glycine max]|nr:hypothetical protein GYH30_049093 [Glycine max]KAH1153283.1 hypothetical protein GYH30_049093 [Glycine max]KAH1153288.1 hypothetical protein GYH30_049093 [Glycine max]KAH1153289.1 hypothetical protein GYH30_049093 [Glycine max]